jgi:hypothetical protein
MPAIDFKEIPQANTGSGDQDTFELFARDFLKTAGFTIEEDPSRGPDRGKDLLVCETLASLVQPKKRRWVVSCKHYAHGGKAVSDSDEIDIVGRVRKFKVDGFMAFYSTVPSSALSQTFTSHKDEIDVEVWDREKIEDKLLSEPRLKTVLARYFPKSYSTWVTLIKDSVTHQVSEGKGQETISVELSETDWTFITGELERLQMTADQWNQVFPNWSNRPSSANAGVILNTKYVDVISAVLLEAPWPGVKNMLDNDPGQSVIFRSGRWCVTDEAIICQQWNYEIGIDRLDEMDWFAHLLEKTWLYDPTDMIDSFEAAYIHFVPHGSQEEIDAYINEQIQGALKENLIPFYPSRVLDRHVYLASRMSDYEREAFSKYLAEQGFVASD